MRCLIPIIFISTVHIKAEGIWLLDALKFGSQQDRYQRSIISQVIETLGTSLGINALGKVEDEKASEEVAERRRDHSGRHTVPLPECSTSKCRTETGPVECGQPVRSSRIVRGDDTTPGAYPWAVGIQFLDKLYCGGSLISKHFIITAAHCVKGINPDRIRLVLGDHDRRHQEEDQQQRLIEKVFLNPHFVKKTFNNDIALIKMKGEVEFSDFIRPVCLPHYDRSYNGHDTIVVGWGKLSEGGLPANVLQEVSVPIIPQKTCRHDTHYRASEITENMFCAGFSEGKIDACQGDSGGPAVWKGDGEQFFTQIGIVSWGQGCARGGYPGVYTRIGRYLEWIVDIIQKHDSCFCPRS